MTEIAVVTGSGSGIGRGVAQKLAQEHFDVAVLDVRADAAKETVAGLAQSGQKAFAYGVDVVDAGGIQETRRRILKDLGQPSVVVNCAGWSVIQPFMENDAAFWKKAIDINLMGTIVVTRTFLEDLLGRGGGRIVNIASDAGRVGSTGEVVYAAAKGGVIAFTKSLAREVARTKVTVNCVCPGPTATPMLMVQDPDRIAALTRAIPMRRLAEPADIAAAVAFFASPGAGYVTGQVLSVSGGLTMAG